MFRFIFMWPGSIFNSFDNILNETAILTKLASILVDAGDTRSASLLSVEALNNLIEKLEADSTNKSDDLNEDYQKIIHHYLRKSEEKKEYIREVEKWSDRYQQYQKQNEPSDRDKAILLYTRAYTCFLKKDYEQTEKHLVAILQIEYDGRNDYLRYAARQLEVIHYFGYEKHKPNIPKAIAYLLKSIRFGQYTESFFDAFNNRYQDDRNSFLHMIYTIIFNDKRLRNRIILDDIESGYDPEKLIWVSQEAKKAKNLLITELYQKYPHLKYSRNSIEEGQDNFEPDIENYKLFKLDNFIAQLQLVQNAQQKLIDFTQIIIECIKINVLSHEFIKEFITVMSSHDLPYLKNKLLNIKIYYYYQEKSYERCSTLLEETQLFSEFTPFDIPTDIEHHLKRAYPLCDVYNEKPVIDVDGIIFINNLNYYLFKKYFSEENYAEALEYFNRITEAFKDYDEIVLEFARTIFYSGSLENMNSSIEILTKVEIALKNKLTALEASLKVLEEKHPKDEKELSKLKEKFTEISDLLTRTNTRLEQYSNPIFKFKTLMKQLGMQVSSMIKPNFLSAFFKSPSEKLQQSFLKFQTFVETNLLITTYNLTQKDNYIIKTDKGITITLDDYLSLIPYTAQLLVDFQKSISNNNNSQYEDIIADTINDLKLLEKEIMALKIKTFSNNNNSEPVAQFTS